MMDILYLPKVGHYNLSWAKDLCNRKMDLRIVTHSTSWIDPENGKMVSFTSNTDKKYFIELSKLQLVFMIIKTRGLFLIHGYGSLYELFLILIAKGRGRKVIVRGEFTPRRRSSGFKIKLFAKKFIAKFVDAFLPVSSEGAYYLERGLNYPGRIEVLPYIVDQKLIDEVAIPSTRKYDCIFVGKLIDRKGIVCLLDALKLYQGKELLRVAVVGDGPLKSKVLDFHAENIQIEYLGFLQPKECYEVIANSKVLILPSTFETWGLVVNEAVMLGANVVGSNAVGSMIELSRYSKKLHKFETDNRLDLMACLMRALDMETNVWLPETHLGSYSIQNHNNKIVAVLNEV